MKKIKKFLLSSLIFISGITVACNPFSYISIPSSTQSPAPQPTPNNPIKEPENSTPDPIIPEKPEKPVESIEQEQPSQNTEPIEPEKPETPSQNIEPTQPKTPSKNTKPAEEPSKPKEPIQNSVVKNLSINKSFLVSRIIQNSYGYTAQSLLKDFEDHRNSKDLSYLKSLVLGNELITWNNITNLVKSANDDTGILQLSFDAYNSRLSTEVTTEDGIRNTQWFFNKIKNLTFSLNIQWMKNNQNSTSTGTGWILNRIINEEDVNNDYLEYLVGTNIHVGSIFSGFLSDDNKIENIKSLTFSWNRHLDNNNNNDGHIVGSYHNIANLEFNPYVKNSLTIAGLILKLRNNTNDWFNGNSKLKIKQMNSILDSLIYIPNNYIDYQTFSNKNVRVNNIGPDFMVLKMQFKKRDLKTTWPKLLKAFENNQEKDFFAAYNTTNSIDKNQTLYTGGYPIFNESFKNDAGTHQQVAVKEEGFTGKTGQYWRNTKLFKNNYTNADRNTATSILENFFENSHGQNKLVLKEERILKYISRNKTNATDENTNLQNSYENLNANNIIKSYLNNYISHNRTITFGINKYLLGGSSGSMVLDAKGRITGIVSSLYPELITGENPPVKHVNIFDLYNDSSVIKGDTSYIQAALNAAKAKNLKTLF